MYKMVERMKAGEEKKNKQAKLGRVNFRARQDVCQKKDGSDVTINATDWTSNKNFEHHYGLHVADKDEIMEPFQFMDMTKQKYYDDSVMLRDTGNAYDNPDDPTILKNHDRSDSREVVYRKRDNKIITYYPIVN